MFPVRASNSFEKDVQFVMQTVVYIRAKFGDAFFFRASQEDWKAMVPLQLPILVPFLKKLMEG